MPFGIHPSARIAGVAGYKLRAARDCRPECIVSLPLISHNNSCTKLYSELSARAESIGRHTPLIYLYCLWKGLEKIVMWAYFSISKRPLYDVSRQLVQLELEI